MRQGAADRNRESTRMPSLVADRRRAATMVLLAATLWGLSGTAAQYLMQHDGIGAGWIVCLRMSVAGPILLALSWRQGGREALFAPFADPKSRVRLVVFAVLGLFCVQYTYIAAIDASNAAQATFLQYLGSAMAVGYTAMATRRLPSGRQILALGAALAGIALVTTDGSIHALAIPVAGLVWGLLAAVALVLNTMLPAPLLKRHGTFGVLGWAMVIGAVAAWAILRPPAWPHAASTPAALALLSFVAVMGTAVPFGLYMASIRSLPASEAMLFANAEPVAAAVAALLWLHVHLGPLAMLGGALVLGATTDLYRRPSSAPDGPAPSTTTDGVPATPAS